MYSVLILISTVVFLVLYLYLSCYVFLPLSCGEKPITSGGDLFSHHVLDSISWLHDALCKTRTKMRAERIVPVRRSEDFDLRILFLL